MIYAGIDLGGTGIKAALATEEGKILGKKQCPTGASREWPFIMQDMCTLIRDLAAEQGIALREIGGVGLGVPGLADPDTGELVYAPNLPGCRHMPAADYVSKELSLPLFIGNDANVAALGESLWGAGRGNLRCTVLITLGTGVGGGVIINGSIFSGAFHGGAELGHMVIHKDGELCGCGRRGCWEVYSSATGLIRSAKQAMQLTPESLLWKLCGGDAEKIDGRIIGQAADEGDEAALRVMDAYLDDLAIGLGNVYNIFQPEILIIGGGISGRGEKLAAPLRERMKKEIYGGDASKLDLRIAELGNDAGVLGACALAMQNVEGKA